MLFSPLLWTFILSSYFTFAQEAPACPPNTTYGVTFTNFTVSTDPAVLYPHIGNFYSPSWQTLLSQDVITFTPPNRTLILKSTILTETLLANMTGPNPIRAFQLRYALTSPASPIDGIYFASYTQSINALLRTCAQGIYTTVVWKAEMCAGGDVNITVEWMKEWHRGAVEKLFSSVAGGWVAENAEDHVEDEGCWWGYGGNDTATTGGLDVPGRGTPPVEVPEAVSMLDSEGGRLRVGKMLGAVLVGLVAVVF